MTYRIWRGETETGSKMTFEHTQLLPILSSLLVCLCENEKHIDIVLTHFVFIFKYTTLRRHRHTSNFITNNFTLFFWLWWCSQTQSQDIVYSMAYAHTYNDDSKDLLVCEKHMCAKTYTHMTRTIVNWIESSTSYSLVALTIHLTISWMSWLLLFYRHFIYGAIFKRHACFYGVFYLILIIFYNVMVWNR